MTEANPFSPLANRTTAHRPFDAVPVTVASMLLLSGAMALALTVSLQKAALFVIGAGLGFALLHGGFGFTAGWRAIVTRGDGRSLKAQLVVIGATMVAFLPIMAGMLPGDRHYGGLIAPLTPALLIGAFMFGIGMQLSNGCGSGTLFTLGGGSKRMLFTLPAFIFGSLLSSLHTSYWSMPGLPAVSFTTEFGLAGGMVIGLAGLVAVWLLVSRYERAVHPNGPPPWAAATPVGYGIGRRVWQGPWTYAWAGLALVVLNIATLLVGQFPWAVTYGFALWGANVASLVGVDVSAYEFWGWAKSPEVLREALVTNQQSVMNVGMVLGAMLAAGLAGSFFAAPWPSWRGVVAAIVGGVLMGYGARMSFGCNIGAFLGGIASGSLHGWVWFASAFLGSLVGIRLRPRFDLPN